MPKKSSLSSGASCLSLLTLAAACLLGNPAAAQTQPLNDTGLTLCANDSAVMVACDAATAGDAGTHPRQDGRFGRDAASPAKVGGGAAGFDFTKVCMNGTLNCTGAANTGASPASAEWACTKDNVTNLIWSLQTPTATWDAASASSYPDAGHNSASRCGFSSGWRLPTVRELLSIVHNGLTDSLVLMIDTAYFPVAPAIDVEFSRYWTSDTYMRDTNQAWQVNFSIGAYSATGGESYTNSKTNADYVRLVRSGP